METAWSLIICVIILYKLWGVIRQRVYHTSCTLIFTGGIVFCALFGKCIAHGVAFIG